MKNVEQFPAEFRAEKSERTGHVRCTYRRRALTVESIQTLADMLTWHAPDSEQWLSGVPHEDKAPTVETVRSLTVG